MGSPAAAVSLVRASLRAGRRFPVDDEAEEEGADTEEDSKPLGVAAAPTPSNRDDHTQMSSNHSIEAEPQSSDMSPGEEEEDEDNPWDTRYGTHRGVISGQDIPDSVAAQLCAKLLLDSEEASSSSASYD